MASESIRPTFRAWPLIAVAVASAVLTVGSVQFRWEFAAFYLVGGFVCELLWFDRDRLQNVVLGGAAPILLALWYPRDWVNLASVIHLTGTAVALLLIGKSVAVRVINQRRTSHAV